MPRTGRRTGFRAGWRPRMTGTSIPAAPRTGRRTSYRQNCLRGTESTSSRASKGSAPDAGQLLLTLALECTKIKIGDPSASFHLAAATVMLVYEVNTVRSAVIDGIKKYAAAVSFTNCSGMASVVRLFPPG